MNFVELRQTTADQAVWVDLGCGASKQPGFIGIDRFALPGVDIVGDLDRGIPLPSDSADYVLASHSLEHLRDLPGAIAEIYRVCKDRAAVTIIAPYASTRLNQANPYHRNAWNEHTARFFTSAAESLLDAEEFDFPSICEWGLSASDRSPPVIDLRCLRLEFLYFPPYRGLDERAKRTLRRSLSDVCDQMALHLLVVKSPITQQELATRAATIQYPVTPAFEARRRDEADTSAHNLISELARTPARISALSTSTAKEIALLGDEMRRFLQRIDHLDKALVAQTQDNQLLSQRVDTIDRALVTEADATRSGLAELSEAGRALGERITAVNAALTRRMLALAEEIRAATMAELGATAEQRSAQAKAGEQILHYLVADRRARADQAFWPLRALRHYRQRGGDLRARLGGEMTRLWQGPEVPQEAGFRLQPGTFFNAGVPRVYALTTIGSPLRGIEIGVLATLPPLEPAMIANFELVDGTDTVLRAGTVGIDPTCVSGPVTIGFAPVAGEPGQALALRLTPHANVERIGVQPLEWHRVTRIVRRVPERRLAWRGVYAG